jgi:hypothetical protein
MFFANMNESDSPEADKETPDNIDGMMNSCGDS